MSSLPPAVTRLVVEIDTATEPVSGRIGLTAGGLEAFVGWTELAAALERLCRPESSALGAGDDGHPRER